MAGSPIRLTGLDWREPHYRTLSRRQKNLTVVIPYRPRGGPLHLVIDSTGLKALGAGEWKVRRHGADKRQVWRKVHLVIDADSHEVRAVEMTDHRHGDGEIVPGLLAQVPKGERIGMISGDGAYDTRGVYEGSGSRDAAWSSRRAATASRGRRGPPGRPSLRAIRHLGRRLWKRWSGYRSRRLAETAMSRLKRLGGHLNSRDPARQTAEVQIRCAILNTFNALGMPDTVARI